MHKRNPKYDWLKNPRWTIPQLEEHRKNAPDPGTKQAITKLIRGRERGGEKPGAEWSQKHNWALFRLMGASSIGQASYELVNLTKSNPIAQEYRVQYDSIIHHMQLAHMHMDTAIEQLKAISADKKEKNGSDNSGSRRRNRSKTPESPESSS